MLLLTFGKHTDGSPRVIAQGGSGTHEPVTRAHSLLAPSGPLGLPLPPSTPKNWYMSVMLKMKLNTRTRGPAQSAPLASIASVTMPTQAEVPNWCIRGG
eukprot:scaffold12692_cov67-Phaeocystis_antarctica.AAC.7